MQLNKLIYVESVREGGWKQTFTKTEWVGFILDENRNLFSTYIDFYNKEINPLQTSYAIWPIQILEYFPKNIYKQYGIIIYYRTLQYETQ